MAGVPDVLLAAFPGLESDDAVSTGLPDDGYNCVAWAVGVTDRRWWPLGLKTVWPPGAPAELTVSAFVAALAAAGYILCDDGSTEPGFEKAALYARAGVPTHVARQLPGGRWSSKLGLDCLVEHATPAGLEGAVYGSVVTYLKRPAT